MDKDGLYALRGFHDRCLKNAVSYSVNYCEGDDTFYVSISSPAPEECVVGKNRPTLEMAVTEAEGWIL
jgi:hypothetical protein